MDVRPFTVVNPFERSRGLPIHLIGFLGGLPLDRLAIIWWLADILLFHMEHFAFIMWCLAYLSTRCRSASSSSAYAMKVITYLATYHTSSPTWRYICVNEIICPNPPPTNNSHSSQSPLCSPPHIKWRRHSYGRDAPFWLPFWNRRRVGTANFIFPGFSEGDDSASIELLIYPTLWLRSASKYPKRRKKGILRWRIVAGQ